VACASAPAFTCSGGAYLPVERAVPVVEWPRPPEPLKKTRSFKPLLLVGLTVMIFRSAYAQSGNTVARWVDRAVDLQVSSASRCRPPAQSLNPLFVSSVHAAADRLPAAGRAAGAGTGAAG
jgi:POT family proton-dependent oligopeptide transporter